MNFLATTCRHFAVVWPLAIVYEWRCVLSSLHTAGGCVRLLNNGWSAPGREIQILCAHLLGIWAPKLSPSCLAGKLPR